jgi:hypothetical protein
LKLVWQDSEGKYLLHNRFTNVGRCADVRPGDELLVDGGLARFEVLQRIGPDVICTCTDPGLILPRASLTFWREEQLVRERSTTLPTLSSKVPNFFSRDS